MEFGELAQSGTFKLWGRNLSIESVRPRVCFVDTIDGKVLFGVVLRSDSYEIDVVAPAELSVSRRYLLEVSNGLGGPSGWSAATEPLSVRPRTRDYWGLGTPWASDFQQFNNVYDIASDPRLHLHAIGDGKANDLPPIQAAIDRASNDGGGVVRLSPGVYAIKLAMPASGGAAGANVPDYAKVQGIVMRPMVVLQGAGADRTVIEYGYGNSPPGACGLVWAKGAVVSGIASLTIRNRDLQGNWQCGIRNLDGGKELFLRNVRIELNTQSQGLSWKGVSEVLLADSEILLGPENAAPYSIEASTWFIVRNNTIHYLRKRMTISDSDDGLIENNHTTRDFSLPLFKPGDSGGLEADYVKRLAILYNKFDVRGKATSSNDGETINTQGCNPENQVLGVVTGSSADQLADQNRHWPALKNYIVAIVTGPAAGQWRAIVNNTANVLSVSGPWLTEPPAGSRYVISRWSAQTILIKQNVLRGNPKGIWLYCGGDDISIDGNKLEDSSGIWLRADQRVNNERYNLLIDAEVKHNKIASDGGKSPAFITIELQQTEVAGLYGTGVYDVDIEHNSIRCSKDNPRDGPLRSGLWSWVSYQHGGQPALLSGNLGSGMMAVTFQYNNSDDCNRPTTYLRTNREAPFQVKAPAKRRG
jgi:hypothetical protein